MDWSTYGECDGQISLFDLPAFSQKTVYKATDFLKEVLLMGTGFENGKERVLAIFSNVTDKKERISLVKKEYGLGGWGSPIKGYGLCGASTYNPKGITVEWKDEEGQKEEIIPWSLIDTEIGILISHGIYQ